MTRPALDALLTVRRGSFVLDAALTVDPGEIVALLGPNGAGKSTLLNALSGVVTPARAEVTVFGRTLDATTERGRVSRVAPERRRIGLLSQDPLLFPHLTALENVAFGRRAQGVSRTGALRDAHEWLDAVGLADYTHRRPAALSGGQQQRVAVARALAARPDLLLLDEPLAALDVQTAAQTRRMLVERLRASGTATVLVTHDALDAITIASRCAILNEGRIIDEGPVDRVLGQPRNAFIAALAGMNFLVGRWNGANAVELPDGSTLRGRLVDGALKAGAPASVTFAPSALRMRRADRGSGSGPGTGPIASLEPAVGGIRVTRSGPALSVVAPHSSIVELGLRIGDPVAFEVDPGAVVVRAYAP